MDITPDEAEQNLAAIQAVMLKTRHSIASSGSYITMIVTGIVWLVGFVCTQFLPVEAIGYVWLGLSILGSVLGTVWGSRIGKRVRNPAMAATAKRVGLYWLFLILFCIVTIVVAWPLDGKQVTVLIVLFAMIGHLAMGLLLSFSAVWWPLPITGLVLISYFLLPNLFYFLDGHPGRRRDDRLGTVHPRPVVSHDPSE